MDKLLRIAIEAHGGLNAWNQFESLRASVSIGMRFGNKKNFALARLPKPGPFRDFNIRI